MADDVVRDSYDSMAELYTQLALGEHGDLVRDPTLPDTLASFAELAVPQDGPVADLGCGPGHITQHLTELGLTVSGYDLSPALIDEARRAFPALDFHVGDIRALDIADSFFGGAVTRHSLIHMPPEDLGSVFAELFRVLAPDAPFLMSFFAAASADDHGTPFDHKVATAYALHPATIARELEQAGFADCNVRIQPPMKGGRPLDHGTILARRDAS